MFCGVFFFFFQAEDGIRDGHVTGVQTCALPISTCVTGPAVPLNWVPLMFSPSTSNSVAPVERFTRARPLRATQANVPALIVVPTQLPSWSVPQTGLSTFSAVITPTTLRQRTVC